MLRVFDAETTIALAIFLDGVREDIEQFRIALVADRVNGDREPGLVSGDDVIAQLAQRLQKDAAGWFIEIALKHLRRRGAERAVDEVFQRTDGDPMIAKTDLNADLCKARPCAERKMQADAQREFAVTRHILQKSQQTPADDV